MILKPQAGPQEVFLSTSADIAIYGGAAGGGKTYALLMENARHSGNKDFGSVIFRRNSIQITNEGGLWDTAMNIYTFMGGKPKTSPRLMVTFPSGAKITFSHLQYDSNVYDYQGAQIPLICFDELTHFTEHQFFYMLSRNRSTCGIKPYIRATCNPDADSWVASFISWWINQDTGMPIQERSGVLRWFFKKDGEIIWGDSAEELIENHDVDKHDIKSITFIPSSIYDNKILLDINPEYLGSLKALSAVEQGRLLDGNWKIRPSAGLYFKRNQVKIVKSIPSPLVSICRAWDLAATEITNTNKDPDRTAGVLMGRMKNGQFIVLDVIRRAEQASTIRQIVQNTATLDRSMYNTNKIRLPQDPGQAGKSQAQSFTKLLAGHSLVINTVTGDKITRAEPLASQWQVGNVVLLEGEWNELYMNEMEGFPDMLHDDRVDASSDAFNEVANATTWNSLIE